MTPVPPGGRHITLAFFPSARGLGWAAFENPFLPVSYGVFTASAKANQATPSKNGQCLNKADSLMGKLQPETVLLEAFETHGASRHDRLIRLSRSITSLAEDRGIDVRIMPRSDVYAAFEEVGARTRDEVAVAVARSVPQLTVYLPRPRRTYDSENKYLALFNAAALVLTNYKRGSIELLDDLRS